MPRTRYQSDETRLKQRPSAKVHLTVATHRKTAAVWADLEMRAMLVELWRLGAEAYAGKTDDTVTLSPAALRSITGRERHFTGVSRLRTLCSRMGYEIRTDGSATTVTIRNFAKKQGWHSAARGVTPQTPPPSESESESEAESRRARVPKRGVKRAPKTPDLFTREAVDALEPAFFETLLHDRPDLSESVRTITHARAWLIFAVPRMDAAGKYTDLRRTARNWFQSARQVELVEAHDRLIKVAIRSAVAADPPKPIVDSVGPLPAMFNVKIAGQGTPRTVGVA